MQFNFNSTEPIYLQVARQIEDAIFTGGFHEGEQVPSTTEISREFHINPATVLKGMNLLVSQGLIEKHRGVGMFVSKGAHGQIIQARQQDFYEKYVIKVVTEAVKLDISKEELNRLIEQGYQYEGNRS
ncbi:GntR family transcriptional regulator [Pediococcus argentinicus]|uniref:GntR family transcriptional regulator n=1 Tax=Pediococcus argentinicus TaxID=480391 RepID=A0A0R2NG55_9LACO|nr:GntR family transcriptional regulator [Pediococcus argentinicus]KRO24776.1 GntR family transcriptional regulator [Pediococcus argentinicus]NKZ22726.1 GntR family transcriptional regulator [Pediococcus argentinicus]GEP19772.1 GntR family transcriptional regulator [Pediococcus argentinicus]